jgi:hypothetical protein
MVFRCVTDESSDDRTFFFGGFAAPETDWDGAFTAAWNERVLGTRPKIPYLHMNEIRSQKWRADAGITQLEAGARIDEACRVIRSTGSMIPTTIYVDRADYDAILRQEFLPDGRQRRTESLEPDLICFCNALLHTLHLIHERETDVDRVDFWVEQNGKISRFIGQIHQRSRAAIVEAGEPELARLIGEFRAVEKTCIAAQAADLLLWHAMRAHSGTLDRQGMRRYATIVDSGHRYGRLTAVSRTQLETLAAGFARRIREAESQGQ